MPYNENDTAGNGAYIFKNGGWQVNQPASTSPQTAPTTDQTPNIGVMQDIKQSAPSELAKGTLQAATSIPDLYQMGRQAAKDYLPEGWSTKIRQAGEKVLPYLPNTVQQLAGAATNPNLTYNNLLPKVEEKVAPLIGAGDKFVEPQTTTGKWVGKGLQLAPSMIGPGGEAEAGMKMLPWLARKGLGLAGATTGSQAVPAAADWLAGGGLKDEYKPWAEMAGILAGGGVGAATPRRVVSPGGVSKGKAALNELAAPRMGKPQSAAEATNSPILKSIGNWLGPSDKYATPQENAAAQMSALRAGKNVVSFDPQFDAEMNAASIKSKGPMQNPRAAPNEVDNFIAQIKAGKSGSGAIQSHGDFYDDMRKEAGRRAAKASSPEIASAYRDIQNSLDSSVERTGVSPPGAWGEARAQQQSVLRKPGRVEQAAHASLPAALGAGIGGLATFLHGGGLDQALMGPVSGAVQGEAINRLAPSVLRSPYYNKYVQGWLGSGKWPKGPVTATDPQAVARLLATQSGRTFGDQGE